RSSSIRQQSQPPHPCLPLRSHGQEIPRDVQLKSQHAWRLPAADGFFSPCPLPYFSSFQLASKTDTPAEAAAQRVSHTSYRNASGVALRNRRRAYRCPFESTVGLRT